MMVALEWQASKRWFSGVVYSHQLRITVGQAIRDLQLIAEVYEPGDIAERIEYLPLQGEWWRQKGETLGKNVRQKRTIHPSDGSV